MKRILKHTLILSMLTCTLTFSTNTKASVADTSLNESTTNEVTTTYNLSETSLSNDTKAVSLPSDKSDYIKSDLSPLTSKVIVLDPGHCKKHIGARGYGLKEEDIVLDISKACKNKLDNYGDITVYTTRTTNNCLSTLGLGDCLTARNRYSKRLNADFLISLHINANENKNKTGALMLAAYDSGYNKRIHLQTTSFGKIVVFGCENTKVCITKTGLEWIIILLSEMVFYTIFQVLLLSTDISQINLTAKNILIQ